MKISRKWRRSWERGNPHYAMARPVMKKDNGTHITARLAKKLLPSVTAAGLLLAAMTTPAYANPTDGQITSGAGSIAQSGSTMTVTQNSNKLSVNWQSFNIAANETVNFVQPGASSVALNRVIGNNASSIYGHLNATGQVFLINPNGVLFARGAQVNVGGLVASTQNLSDSDFLAGNYKFSGSGGAVINQGTITAAKGGYVALLGSQVSNQGVIAAQQGKVALAAGNATTLDFNGDGLLNLAVNQSAVKALAENKNLIQADGGQVLMTARAADALAGTVVNNSGVIRAKSVNNSNGVITLDGGASGKVNVSGTLDVSGQADGQTGGVLKVLGNNIAISGAAIDSSGAAGGGTVSIGGNRQGKGPDPNATNTTVDSNTTINANAITSGNGGNVTVWADGTTTFAGTITARGGSVSGNGGSVETSGKNRLMIADTGKVVTTAAQGKTGNWLLDPNDFTIDDSGSRGMTAAALSSALSSSDVTITTSESGSAASNTGGTIATSTTGTNGDINVNSTVSWFSGQTLSLSAYRDININASITASGADAGVSLVTGTGGSGNYKMSQGAAITLAGAGAHFSLNNTPYTVLNNYSAGGALQALQNIGNNPSAKYFVGIDIDASATSDSAYNSGAGFIPIWGSDGSLFSGILDGGGHCIDKLYINNPSRAGLFGATASGAILRNLGVTGTVTGGGSGSLTGALVGYNSGLISNCYSSSTVSNSAIGGYVGGLVGVTEGIIKNSYNTGRIIGVGGDQVGGLAGTNYGSISNSYNTGVVTSGSGFVGGLAGENDWHGIISDSYNTGSVAGSYGGFGAYGGAVGGLVGYGGWGSGTGTIQYSYSTGKVTGGVGDSLGGLVGKNNGSTITQSYWDQNTSGRSNGVGSGNADGASPLTSSGGAAATAFYQTNYHGFDFSSSNPVWYMVEGQTRPFLRSEYSNVITNSHQLQLMAMDLGASYTLAHNVTLGELADDAGMWRTFNTKDSESNYGFVPIGEGDAVHSPSNPFNGSLNGQGHTITNLVIHSDKANVGLFGSSAGAVSNIGLVNYEVVSSFDDSYAIPTYSHVGGLVGYNTGNVSISYVTGTLTGKRSYIGGLVGYNCDGTILNSYSAAAVTGGSVSNIGGLVGYNDGNISNSYSMATTFANGMAHTIGGLVGANFGTIVRSYWDIDASCTETGVGSITDTDSTDAVGLYSDPASLAADPTRKSALLTSSYDDGWNIATAGGSGGIWRMYDGYSHPLLLSFLTPLTVTVNDAVYTYDKNPHDAAGVSYSRGYDSALVSGSLSYSYTQGGAAVSPVNAGTYVISTSGLYSTSQQGYDISYATGSLHINPRPLLANPSGFISKVYDGTNAAALDNHYTLSGDGNSGVISGDNVFLTASGGAYNDTTVAGANKVTFSSISLSGGAAGNYSLSTSASQFNGSGGIAGQIIPRQLTAAASSTISKVYDGNNTADLGSHYILSGDGNSGVVSGDDISLTATDGVYNDTTVAGANKVTFSSISLSGGAAGNYSLSTSASQFNGSGGIAGQITPRQLTAAASSTISKIYDGNNTASLGSHYILSGDGNSGVVSGDDISLTATGGTYNGTTVAGTNKVTFSSISLSGGAADNYSLSTSLSQFNGSGGIAAQITPRQLTASASGTISKVYDGNNTASLGSRYTLTGYGNSGVVNGDDVILIGNGEYNDATVAGANKVTFNSIGLSGGAAGNYSLSTSASQFNGSGGIGGQITPRQLTASAISTISKVYDGNNTASLGSNYILSGNGNSGVVSGDDISLTATGGTYNGTTVAGTNKVTFNSISLSGGAADNYSLSTSASQFNGSGGIAGQITPRQLTASAGGTISKVYDGNNTANLGSRYILSGDGNSGVVGGDDVTLIGNGEYNDATVAGANKVTFNSIGLSGGAAGNYSLSTSASQFNGSGGIGGQITPRQLTAAASSTISKVYDGNNTASLGGQYSLSGVGNSGVVSGDNVTLIGTGEYNDKNVAGATSVTFSSIGLSGGAASNYSLSTSINQFNGSGIRGQITAAALTIAANDATKQVGTPNPTFAPSYTGFVSGDTPSALSGALLFTTTATESSPPGSYHITPYGLSSTNYNISFIDGTLTITRPPDQYNGALVTANHLVAGDNEPSLTGLSNRFRLNITGEAKPLLTIIDGGINLSSVRQQS